MADDSPESDSEEESPPAVNYQSPAFSVRTVRVSQYQSRFEAGLACAALQAEGIDAVIAGAGHSNDFGVMAHFDLMVAEDQLIDARRVLQEIEARKNAHHPAGLDMLRCPRCGSNDCWSYDRRVAKIWLGSLVFIVIGMVGPSFDYGLRLAFQGIVAASAISFCLSSTFLWAKRTCRTCGHVFLEKDADIDDSLDEEDSPPPQ